MGLFPPPVGPTGFQLCISRLVLIYGTWQLIMIVALTFMEPPCGSAWGIHEIHVEWAFTRGLSLTTSPPWVYGIILGGLVVKNPPTNTGDKGLMLGLGRSPGKRNATHSSILAWELSWIEEPGGLQSMMSQRAGHDWVTEHPHPKDLPTVWHLWAMAPPLKTVSRDKYADLDSQCYQLALTLNFSQ